MDKVSNQDKRAIVARNFFNDNKEGEDAYEDYREALIEISNPENVNDTFIDFAVQPYLQRKEGCRLMMKDGFVVSIREADGFLEPLTEMTQDEGEEIENAFQDIADKFPNVESSFVLMQKLGWKLL